MHDMVTKKTRYGIVVWCRYCKVTPAELSSMNSEEKSEQEAACTAIQEGGK